MQRRTGWLVRFFLVLLIIFSLTPQVWAQGEPGKLTIRYFNLEVEDPNNVPFPIDPEVKGGDAILITTPEGQNLLIDSSVSSLGYALIKRLEELEINRIDYAFATHPHVDHIGGYLTLLGTIEVGKFYQINVPYTASSTYRRLQTLLTNHQIVTEFLEQGDVLHIGDVTLEVLNPPKGTSPETIPEEKSLSTPAINDLSLVMRLDFKSFSLLFTGDMYMAREMELLDQYEPAKFQVDILDVPHHGSKTSSSTLLVATAEPKFAIMSTDGIASIEVYKKYRMFDAEVYVTGNHGEVTIVTDGENIEITSERESNIF